MELIDGQLVVVTGAAGFVGSHLCERLLERGQQVLALDNLVTGEMAHIQHLIGHPGFSFARHDICELPPPAVHSAARVFNLACPASPPDYQRAPVATTLTSVLGLWRLMEALQGRGARLLQTSTSEVYGDPLEHPQRLPSS
jgi:UDP-glucuronate decarboxylase